jgi:hypothetical protein
MALGFDEEAEAVGSWDVAPNAVVVAVPSDISRWR